MLYLHTAFGYHSDDFDYSVFSEVNLCFHDIAGYKQNYFFNGDSFFSKDWINMREQVQAQRLKRSKFKFDIRHVTQAENTENTENKERELDLNIQNLKEENFSYSFEYDFGLFGNYDGQPIKVYYAKLFEQCDVFVGDFFQLK